MANNMNSFTTLIKRLEAATSRLEDIASTSFPNGESGGAPPAANGAQSPGPAAKLAAATSATGSPTPPTESVPPAIEAHDGISNNELKTFLDLSSMLGEVIEGQSKVVQQGLAAQRKYIFIANKAKKPDDHTLMSFVGDLQASIEKADEIRQHNREAALKDPLSLVADGMGSLGWIALPPGSGMKPVDYIKELFGGAQMYGNKVLKEYKDKPENKTFVDWVRAYYKLFEAQIEYAKKHHPTGVAWNPNGIDAKEAAKQVSSTESSSSIPPPPPPPPGGIPPPPGPPPPGAAPAAKKAAPDMNAVFDDLNRGSDVTKGLKKVDASQMTHKNPSLRAQAPVPTRSDSNGSLRSKSPAPPGKKPKPESMRTKKPPRKELDGNRWIVENFDSPTDPVEIEAELNHTILVSRCKNTTIRVLGKTNAISIDNSSRTSIIVDSLVSSVDVIKCPNFAIQVIGTLPTILLDQVDGAIVYLSKESLNTEIFTSKCSSININVPTEDDFVENPVPEQMRSYIKNGKVVSEIVEHAG